MRKLTYALASIGSLVCGWTICAAALAQQPAVQPKPKYTKDPETAIHVSTSELAPTPAMWFYEQQRRRAEDPRTIIRERAQLAAAQRDARLAAQRWFGFSNLRPQAGMDPYDGAYAPKWVSNSYLQNNWVGNGNSTTVFSPERRY